MANNAGRVVFIGAAGETCRLAIERFAVADGQWEPPVCQRLPHRARPLSAPRPSAR